MIQNKQGVKPYNNFYVPRQKEEILTFNIQRNKRGMMMKRQMILGVILLGFLVIFLGTTQVEAARPLRTSGEIQYVFQFLQRGPVPPSDRNGCTHIPRQGGSCRG